MAAGFTIYAAAPIELQSMQTTITRPVGSGTALAPAKLPLASDVLPENWFAKLCNPPGVTNPESCRLLHSAVAYSSPNSFATRRSPQR